MFEFQSRFAEMIGLRFQISELRGIRVSKRNYWLLFLGCQTAGLVLPQFANVHTNPWPLFLGALLLFPGCLIELIQRISANSVVEIAGAVLINGAAWYILRKILLLDYKAS